MSQSESPTETDPEVTMPTTVQLSGEPRLSDPDLPPIVPDPVLPPDPGPDIPDPTRPPEPTPGPTVPDPLIPEPDLVAGAA